MSERYFEDYVVGQRFESGPIEVSEQEIVAFARAFDPQPFHVDPAAGAASVFGGLVASGWHTTALAMRLFVNSEAVPAAGSIGLGVDELRWPRPVRPGDSLRLVLEVLEMRPSQSRPDVGIGRIRMTMFNQHDELVLAQIPRIMVPRRENQAAIKPG